VTSRLGTGKSLALFNSAPGVDGAAPVHVKLIEGLLELGYLFLTARHCIHVRAWQDSKEINEEERKRRGRHKPLQHDLIGSLGCRKWGT
jgi:hypothetical protein